MQYSHDMRQKYGSDFLATFSFPKTSAIFIKSCFINSPQLIHVFSYHQNAAYLDLLTMLPYLFFMALWNYLKLSDNPCKNRKQHQFVKYQNILCFEFCTASHDVVWLCIPSVLRSFAWKQKCCLSLYHITKLFIKYSAFVSKLAILVSFHLSWSL